MAREGEADGGARLTVVPSPTEVLVAVPEPQHAFHLKAKRTISRSSPISVKKGEVGDAPSFHSSNTSARTPDPTLLSV